MQPLLMHKLVILWMNVSSECIIWEIVFVLNTKSTILHWWNHTEHFCVLCVVRTPQHRFTLKASRFKWNYTGTNCAISSRLMSFLWLSFIHFILLPFLVSQYFRCCCCWSTTIFVGAIYSGAIYHWVKMVKTDKHNSII